MSRLNTKSLLWLVAVCALTFAFETVAQQAAAADEQRPPEMVADKTERRVGVASKAAAGSRKRPLSALNKGALGYWKHIDEDTGKTDSIFKVWLNKGKLVGKIVRVFPKPGEKPNKLCTECEGRRHNRPVVGMTFFWGFTPDEDEQGKWVDGKILNPDDGEVYSAEAELSADGKRLEVFGYVRVLIKIGGTSVWQRPTARELQGL